MYNPLIHHRHSIRLKGYDYSQAGLYFITICTHDRKCLFGSIENSNLILNNSGKVAHECWNEIPKHFPQIKLHEYIIMPNHIHGILEIDGINTDLFDVGANQHSSEIKNLIVGRINIRPKMGRKMFRPKMFRNMGRINIRPFDHHHKQLDRWCVVLKLV